MSAVAFFNAARAYKRELTGEPGVKLTQEDVDLLNAATEKRWKKRETLHLRTPTVMKNPSSFFQAVRESFGPLDQEQVDGTNFLLEAMGASGWPIAWVAYALATAWHETAHTMQPIKERGGHAYLDKYDTGRLAARLGNTPEDDDDGQKYAGRGYVQLTGRSNYVNAGIALGIDLPENPDLALQADIAAKILVWGMAGGKFTGKGLKDYLPDKGPANHRQFVLARYIINGQDKASTIADIALKFQTALALGEWA